METFEYRLHIPRKSSYRILMIGNSFCMHFSDELYGMAKADGIELYICSVVAAACTLEKHWTWHEKREKNCTLVHYDAEGYRQELGMGLEDCLNEEWDIISVQDGEYYYRLGGFDQAKQHMEPYLGNLVRVLRDRYPMAAHCFHQVWAYQAGYYRPDKSPFRVPDVRVQNVMHSDLKRLAQEACEEHGLLRIPTGDAWVYARSDVRVGDTLCMSDNEHDGESEGGQYLNACVWYELLFCKSCLDNAYVPPYPLPEDKFAAIREAAHKAVADCCGQYHAD